MFGDVLLFREIVAERERALLGQSHQVLHDLFFVDLDSHNPVFLGFFHKVWLTKRWLINTTVNLFGDLFFAKDRNVLSIFDFHEFHLASSDGSAGQGNFLLKFHISFNNRYYTEHKTRLN